MINRNEPKARKAAARWASALLPLLLITSQRCLAHDPYEITANVRIETNRTAVEIEMEFNTAMLLVGGPRATAAQQTAWFQTKLPELQQAAARFFELGDADGALVASGTNVTLGVENHVKLNLEFPRAHGGLKLHATAVKSLGAHGPYGVSVTVLDMVNLKVLGQSVLFSNSAAAEFGEVVKVAEFPAAASPSNAPAPKPAMPAAATTGSGAQPSKRGVSLRFVAAVAAMVLLAGFMRWLVARRRR